jgi:methylated-DNA-[protein]-cysteine S-methyltransferase
MQVPSPTLHYAGPFTNTVWETLVGTSIGDTLSYKELAGLSGSPKAARAVGRAVKSHCIPILVPCHRVVRAGEDPQKGRYSGGDGVATKMWLLEHEKKMVEQTLVAEESD